MTSAWVDALGSRFQRAFDLMDAAVRDCQDDLWQANMWDVPDDDPARELRGPNRDLVTDPAGRLALVQRYGTPWAVAWHALERLDFLITGGFVPWAIWPPLAERLANGTAAAIPAAPGVSGHTGLDVLTMATPWSRSDLLGYSDYCRKRVVETLEGVTDASAAMLVGRRTYAARLMQAQDHVVEHASQIRQFITAASKASDARPSRFPRATSPGALDSLLEGFVSACLDVFGAEHVEAIVLHGSALKGGFIRGYSDIDFMVFLAPPTFNDRGDLPDATVFALQERVAALPWQALGFNYPQAYFYDARRMPDWWTGPVPGAYRLLHGALPAGIEATAEALRAGSRRFLQSLPGDLASQLRNFADSDDSTLPRRVRLIGTGVSTSLFVLLTLAGEDPLEVWSLSKLEALERVERLHPDSEGPRLARDYFESVARLFASPTFDSALGRGAFRTAVRYLRWVEAVIAEI